MENSSNKKYRSKTIEKTVWVNDLQNRPVMLNDEKPSQEIDFSDADVFEKTIQRFRNAGLHSVRVHAA